MTGGGPHGTITPIRPGSTGAVAAAVAELNQRYAHFVDRRQWDAWERLFTWSATLVLRGERIEGAKAIVARIRAETDHFSRMRHLIFPPSVVNSDGPVVGARAYFILRGTTTRGRDFEAMGVYEDQIDARRLRFESRSVEFDFFTARTTSWNWEAPPGGILGASQERP